jgi:hypothetical protein
MMNQKNQSGTIDLPDMKALVAFAKVGISMMASRMLSLLALSGILALAAYSVYFTSVIGAGCVSIIAIFVFIPALKAESRREEAKDGE